LEDLLSFSDFVDLGITSETTRKQLEERRIVTNLTLATPYKKGINKLTTAYDKSLEVGIGQVHEFDFNIPFYVERDNKLEKNSEIEFLKEYYLIKVELPNIRYSKWFRIQRVEKHGESDEDYLHVQAYTLERELADKIVENAEFNAENLFTIAHSLLGKSQWKISDSEQNSLTFNGKDDYVVASNVSSNKLEELTLQFWLYEEEDIETEEDFDFRIQTRVPYRWAFGYTESEDIQWSNVEEEGEEYDITKSYTKGDIVWYDGLFYEVVEDIAEEDELNPRINCNDYEYEEGYKYKQTLDELDKYDTQRIVKYIVEEEEFPKEDLKEDIDKKEADEEDNTYDGMYAALKDLIDNWEWNDEEKDEDTGKSYSDPIVIGRFLDGSIDEDDLIEYMDDTKYIPGSLSDTQKKKALSLVLGASYHYRIKRREAFRKRKTVSNALIFGRTLIGIGNSLFEIRKDEEDRESDDIFYVNNWTHWTFTYKYDRTNEKVIYKVYADGHHFYSDEIENVEESDLPDLDNKDFYIGAVNYDGKTSNFFKGQIDEIRIFNKFFSQEEVNNTMHIRYMADEEDLREHEKFTDNQKEEALGIWQCKKGDERDGVYQGLDEVFDHSDNENDITGVKEYQWYDDHVYLRNDQGEKSNFKFLFRHRSVTLNDTNILNSFTESIADTFEAVPVFITGAEKDEAYEGKEREVYFIKPEEVGEDRGLRFRYGVLLDSVEVVDETTDFCTRLRVYGKDNLTFGDITHTGATFLDNFYYFHYPYEHDENYNVIKHSNFMTDNLAGAIQEYNQHVENYEGVNELLYRNLRTLRNEYDTLQRKIWDEEFELAQVQQQLDVVKEAKMEEDNIMNEDGVNLEQEMERLIEKEEELKEKIEQLEGKAESDNKEIVITLKELDRYIGDKKVEIDEEETLIGLKGIDKRIEELKEIQEKLHKVLDIRRFFEEELYEEQGYFKYKSLVWDALRERDQFIIEKTINNEYIDNAEELYEWAKEQFVKIATPQIKVDIDVLDFIDLVEFDHLWDKIRLGDTVHIYREDLDINVKAEITEVTFNLDDGDMNFTISNVRDVKKPGDKFIESIKNSINVSNEVQWNKDEWQEAFNKVKEHDGIIESEWDASARRIRAGIEKKNQSVDISRRGIIIRNPDEPEKFLVAQNGILAITDDGGKTFKHAIRHDGIIAERLVSQAIVGRNLHLVNRTGEDERYVIRMNEDGLKGFKYDGKDVEDAVPDAENISFRIDRSGNAYFSGHLRVGGTINEPNLIITTAGAIFGGRYGNGTDVEDNIDCGDDLPPYLRKDKSGADQVFRFGITSEGDAFFHGRLQVGWNEDAGENYEFVMDPDEKYFKALWLPDVGSGKYLLELDDDYYSSGPIGIFRGNLRVGYHDNSNKYELEVDQDDGELRAVLVDSDNTNNYEHQLVINDEGIKMVPVGFEDGKYHFQVKANGDFFAGYVENFHEAGDNLHLFEIDVEDDQAYFRGDLQVGYIKEDKYYLTLDRDVSSENEAFLYIGEHPDDTMSVSSLESETPGSLDGTDDAIENLVMTNHAGFTKRGTFWAGVTADRSASSEGAGAFIVPFNSDGVYNYYNDGTEPSSRWKLDDGTYIRQTGSRIDFFFTGSGEPGSKFSARDATQEDEILRVIDDGGHDWHTIIDKEAKVHNAVYNDLAEYMDVKGNGKPLPNSILIETGEGLTTTNIENDHRAIGVYSDTYGFCLGKKSVNNEATAVPIGMAGKVKVKIQGKVEVGDFIVTSNMPGYAKATKEYTPGTVVGKALESKNKKEDKRVWMLIMPC